MSALATTRLDLCPLSTRPLRRVLVVPAHSGITPTFANQFPKHCKEVPRIPCNSAGTEQYQATAQPCSPQIFVTLGDAPRIEQQEASVFSKVEDPKQKFRIRFARYRGLLRFVASRLLDDGEEAEQAVRNSHRAATNNPKEFAYEGDFRSWLFRILIAEALQILHQRKSLSESASELVFSQER